MSPLEPERGSDWSPTVAVIIPTKDRPEYLDDAIDSALQQTYPTNEVVIVDDGSKVPVSQAELRKKYGVQIKVLRNDASRGLAYSRNRGVEECGSEYVIHLDDDDLLREDAIETCIAVLRKHTDLELLTFAVKGFDKNSNHFNKVQNDGLEKVITLGEGTELEPGIILFESYLFPALLKRVPMAMQRTMISASKWNEVSLYRREIYSLDSEVGDVESAKYRLTGPLRDSEWVKYAALLCKKIGLIKDELYLQRCGNQGYSSRPENKLLHQSQEVDILKHLVLGAEHDVYLKKWKEELEEALATKYFARTYQYFHGDERWKAYLDLISALRKKIKWKYLRFGFRMLLPRTKY